MVLPVSADEVEIGCIPDALDETLMSCVSFQSAYGSREIFLRGWYSVDDDSECFVGDILGAVGTAIAIVMFQLEIVNKVCQ